MSTIGPGEIGGWFGSTGWYRATGESVVAPDGSIAWKYTNPYTWFDGGDRNEGNEMVRWAIELRTPLTAAPVVKGLYLVQVPPPQQSIFPIVPFLPGNPDPPTTPPITPPVVVITDPTGPGGGGDITPVPEPTYALLTAMVLVLLLLVFRRRVRA